MVSTIKDVARLSGVSVATISNVITRKKYVSPEVTERVLQAMQRLKYRPNMIARSLKVKKTNNIGVIVPDISNPFFADIVMGVESLSKKGGGQFFLCSTDGELESEEAALNAFISQNVDGIINIAPRMPDDRLLEWSKLPQVVIDRPIEAPPTMGCICSNNDTGCQQLARHFLAMGHERFACFAGPVEVVPNARARWESFRDELRRHSIPSGNIVSYSGEFSFHDGYTFMTRLLSRKAVPTAVFVSSDLMAWGALECAKKHGLRIPEDMAIAGFDNVNFSTMVAPALTTIDAPKFKAGVLGFQMLLDLIAGTKNLERVIVIDTELVVRDSTDFKRKRVKRLTAGRSRRVAGGRADSVNAMELND